MSTRFLLTCILIALPGPAFAQWTAKASLPSARASAGAAAAVSGKLYVVGGLGASALATMDSYDPTTNSWTTKTSMPTARTQPGVGVVNGIIYVIGGMTGSGTFLTTVEAYDPASDSWTTKASLPATRAAMGVAVVNGILYSIAGTSGSGNVSDVYAYDPQTNSWTTKASIPTARYEPAVGVINGIIYVAGSDSGGGTYLSTVESYEPATNSWTTRASMGTPRGGAAHGVIDGIFYVAGGTSTGYSRPTTAESYNPATNSWTTQPSLSTPRSSIISGVLSGVLYALGGDNGTSRLSNNEAFQPKGTWSTTGNMSVARHLLSATLLSNGSVLAAGGYNGTAALASAELYNSSTGTWSATGSMAVARYRHTATLLADGKVLVAGGVNSVTVSSAELFDPSSGTWTTTGSMTTARAEHRAVLLANGKVLVAGGHSVTPGCCYQGFWSSAELYDPSTGTWSATDGMDYIRSGGHSLTVLANGNVLVAGGEAALAGQSCCPGYTTTAELYNVSTGTWALTGSMATARHQHSATLLSNGRVLVAGSSGSVASAESFNSATGTWSTAGSLSISRTNHTATTLANSNFILFTGGTTNTSARVDIYDVAAGTFSSEVNMSNTRVEGHRAMLLQNNRLLVVGGSTGSSTLSSAELYTSLSNEAPTISDVTNRSTNEDTQLSGVTFTVADSATAAASLTVSGASSNTTLVPNSNITFGGSGASRTVSITPAGNLSGTATITLTVSDGELSATDTFVLTVNAVNDTPTISDVANQTVNEDAATSALAITIGDIETATGSLTMSGSSSNTTLVPANNIVFGGSGANRTVTITPAANQSGTATITLTVSDGELNASDTLVVTVNAANDPPTISAVANQTINEDTSTSALAVTVGDVETTAADLTITRASSNTTLVPVENIVLGGSGANRTVTITPATSQSGTATITLTVTDGANATASHTFALTVTAVNDAPTISDIGNQAINQNASLSNVAFTIGDVETAVGSLTVSSSSSNTTLVPNSAITIGGSGASRTVSITPAANQSGTATITLTVSDEGNATASDTFVLTVGGSNVAPTISDVGDQATNEDTAVNVTLTIGDAETSAGSLSLSGSSSNTTLVPTSNITFGGSGASRTVSITPVSNQSGTATITLTVSDGIASVSDTFLVTVAAVNDAPTISDVTNKSVDEDGSLSATAFTVSDVETAAGSLTVTATSSNTTLVPTNNISLSGSGGDRLVSITPAANQSGTTTITLTVSDGSAIASDTFVLTVNAVNDTPTISDIASQTTNEDTTIANVAFTVSDVETAATSLTISVSSSNSTLVPDGNITLGGSGSDRTISIAPVGNESGTATILVTVSDGAASSSDTFVVTVGAVNDAPTISDVTNQTIAEDGALGATAFRVSDAETFAGTLTVTGTSSNTTLVPNAQIAIGGGGGDRTVAITPVANQSGVTTITLTVSDGTAVSSDTFDLTVTAVNDPPTISDITDQVIVKNTPLNNVLFSIADNETATSTLTVTASASSTSLVPANAFVIGTTLNVNERTLSITPAANQLGTTMITVTVSDGSATASDTFQLTVSDRPEPVVTALAASQVARNIAMLNGLVDPRGGAGINWFEWGTAENNLTQRTPDRAHTATGTQVMSESLTGLVEGTTYFFQAVAQRTGGAPQRSAILRFTTNALAQPAPTTLPASEVARTSAVLNGSINVNGVATTYWFAYGTSASNLAFETRRRSLPSDGNVLAVTAEISDLTPNRTYFFQARAEGPTQVTQRGAVLNFRTVGDRGKVIVKLFLDQNEDARRAETESFIAPAESECGAGHFLDRDGGLKVEYQRLEPTLGGRETATLAGCEGGVPASVLELPPGKYAVGVKLPQNEGVDPLPAWRRTDATSRRREVIVDIGDERAIDFGVMPESGESASYSTDLFRLEGTGGPDRPPIVLIHGWAGDCDSAQNCPAWDALRAYFRETPPLRDRFDLYAFRYAGYGLLGAGTQRTRNHSIPRLQGLGAELRRLLKNTFANRRPILIAHSLGGLIARSAMQEWDWVDRVETLITLGTPHHGIDSATLGRSIWGPAEGRDRDLTALKWDQHEYGSYTGADNWLRCLNGYSDRGCKEPPVGRSRADQVTRTLSKLHAIGGIKVVDGRVSFDDSVVLTTSAVLASSQLLPLEARYLGQCLTGALSAASCAVGEWDGAWVAGESLNPPLPRNPQNLFGLIKGIADAYNAKPREFTARLIGGSARLGWMAPVRPGASYQLEGRVRGAAGNAADTLAAARPADSGWVVVGGAISSTSFDIVNMPSGSFEVRVRSMYGDGITALSGVAPLDVGMCSGIVGVPMNLTATSTGQFATVAWDAAAEGCPATTYQLGVGSRDGRSDVAIVTLGGRAVGGAVAPGNYYLRVRALHNNRAGDWSEDRLLTVGVAPPPLPPTNLAATVQGNTVTISWSPPASGSPVTGYVLEAGSAAGLSDIAELRLAGATISAAGIPPGRYFLRVRAVGATGISVASEEFVIVVN